MIPLRQKHQSITGSLVLIFVLASFPFAASAKIHISAHERTSATTTETKSAAPGQEAEHDAPALGEPIQNKSSGPATETKDAISTRENEKEEERDAPAKPVGMIDRLMDKLYPRYPLYLAASQPNAGGYIATGEANAAEQNSPHPAPEFFNPVTENSLVWIVAATAMLAMVYFYRRSRGESTEPEPQATSSERATPKITKPKPGPVLTKEATVSTNPRVQPKQCPVCSGALTPLQQWGWYGGDLARCTPCRKLFVVTSLPQWRYGMADSIIGAWFVNVSRADENKLGLDFDLIERFDALKNDEQDLDAARGMIEETRADAGKMALELLFYEKLYGGVPATRLRQYIENSIDFLLNTDPSTYVLPIDEQLPKGRYEFENPFEYLPARSTLIVFKPDLGQLFRDRYGLLVDEVLADLDECSDARLISRSRGKLVADHTYHRWCTLWNLVSPYWTAKTTRQLKAAGELYGMSLNYAKDGKEQDAVVSHHKAADLGLVDARYTLGLRYASGRGVSKDEEQAQRWFRKAAEAWDSRSKNILAMRYGQDGILKDDNQAWESYLKAAWDEAVSRYEQERDLGDQRP